MTEPIHAGVLQQFSDDGTYRNRFRNALQSRSQAANAAHDAFNLYPGAACFIEQSDDVGIDELIALQNDVPAALCFVQMNFFFNERRDVGRNNFGDTKSAR